jgi:hypothetical protein
MGTGIAILIAVLAIIVALVVAWAVYAMMFRPGEFIPFTSRGDAARV